MPPMPTFALFGAGGGAAAAGSAAATSSLASFLGPFALFGSALSIFGGIQQNRAIEQAARKQALLEQFKATDQKIRVGRQTETNIGAILASSADRNTVGRSSKAVVLNQISKGLQAEGTIDYQKSMNILSITQNAQANKVNLLEQAVGGAVGGLAFGTNLRSLGL